MTTDGRPRPWPLLPPALFSAALVLYASVMPLGLSRVEGASVVADALGLDVSGTARFLPLLALRVGQLVPLGDTPLRATWVCAVFCALAVAFTGRLALDACALLRPPANARNQGVRRHLTHEPLAAAGAAVAFALSVSTFELGVTSSTAAATLALLLAAVLAGFALLRDYTSWGAGYGLAALSGLAVGVDPFAGPLLWPLLLGISIWALRKGARWPLMVPLCFVAAWGCAVLAALASSATPLSLRALLAGSGSLGVNGHGFLAATAIELADQVGVIGALLAVIGAAALISRAPVRTTWLLLTGCLSLLVAGALSPTGHSASPTRAAFPLAAAIACAFAAAGLVHIARRLGRARTAGGFALAVILILSPALDGGSRRWAHRTFAPLHLLDRALERAQIRHLVCPGTAEMDGLFRLAKAQGLRPDLDLGRCDGR